MMKKLSGDVGRVLEYLKTHEGITSMEAFEMFGATRLSAIIFILRKYGYCIKNVKHNGKNKFGDSVHYDEYQLIGEEIC